MTSTYLKLIGKGQVTIPQAWRRLLGKDIQFVKASLIEGKIVIEPAEPDKLPDWEIESVSLNKLPREDKATIQANRKAYRAGDKDAFISLDDFTKGNF
jgi:bifunctional DNA-binding transcriptional regulator/antitoxin component of YhaV-PrlF toxin-antitoxin module